MMSTKHHSYSTISIKNSLCLPHASAQALDSLDSNSTIACARFTGTISKRMKIGSCGLKCKPAKTIQLSDNNNGWGRRRLPPKICAQSDPPPLKSTDFDPVSAYNVSTVRASEKCSIIAHRK